MASSSSSSKFTSTSASTSAAPPGFKAPTTPASKMNSKFSLTDTLTERNKADIDLGYQTMLFFDKLDESRYDLRSLAVNICDMQSRFSEPQELPFGLTDENGAPLMDMEATLATTRPLNVLLKLRAAYLCPDKFLLDDEEYEVDEDGKKYCLAGGDSWEAMVKAGVLSGNDATAVKDSVWLWLDDLFQVFSAERERPEVRRLAACWYYTATEVDLISGEDEAEDDNQSEKSASAMVASRGTLAVANDTDSDDEDDDDDVPILVNTAEEEDGQSPPTKKAAMSKSSASQKLTTSALLTEDFTDDDTDDDFVPSSNASEVDTEEFDSGEEEGDEGLGAAMGGVLGAMVSAMGDDSMQQLVREESPEGAAIRERILKTVGELDAYLPSPETHLHFFKRMLQKVTNASDDAERWFPWGRPPLQHMVDVLTKNPEEDERGNFLRETLTVFAEAQ